MKTSNEQKKIFRLKVDLGCFRSIKALFWKSEIDFPCVQPIRIAKEHERVQGEKKEESFFFFKKKSSYRDLPMHGISFQSWNLFH